MVRLPASLAAVFTAALLIGSSASIVAVGSTGCAVPSSAPDLAPNVDPNLPGLDAASDPHPTPGSHDDAATGTADPDASRTTFAPDAGDAAPGISRPSAGEVVISEVMYSTTTPEPASEWIELHNTTTSVRSLHGLVLEDGGGRTHTITQAVTIPPGAYAVLVRSKAGALAAKVPASAILYEYGAGVPETSGILLTNGTAGGVALLDGQTPLSVVPYGGWFAQSGGSSVQLKTVSSGQQKTRTTWCLSSTPWAPGSDRGTPGAPCDCP